MESSMSSQNKETFRKSFIYQNETMFDKRYKCTSDEEASQSPRFINDNAYINNQKLSSRKLKLKSQEQPYRLAKQKLIAA